MSAWDFQPFLCTLPSHIMVSLQTGGEIVISSESIADGTEIPYDGVDAKGIRWLETPEGGFGPGPGEFE